MSEEIDIDLGDVSDDDIRDFCAAIGELILRASVIDGHLNQAMVSLLVLPDNPAIEPIVAQLDPRAKAELLKKRAKLGLKVPFRNEVVNWVERAEKVNAKRNIVAHHGIGAVGGKLFLRSDQLGKLFDSMELSEGKVVHNGFKSAAEVKDWILQAKAVQQEGEALLKKFRSYREKGWKLLAEKGMK